MTAPAKKVWGIGDKAYALTGSRIFAGKVVTVSAHGHVYLQDGRGGGMWASTRALHADRRALDVVALERQIREADKNVKAADAAVDRATRAHFREIRRRKALAARLVAVKAKVSK